MVTIIAINEYQHSQTVIKQQTAKKKEQKKILHEGKRHNIAAERIVPTGVLSIDAIACPSCRSCCKKTSSSFVFAPSLRAFKEEKIVIHHQTPKSTRTNICRMNHTFPPPAFAVEAAGLGATGSCTAVSGVDAEEIPVADEPKLPPSSMNLE